MDEDSIRILIVVVGVLVLFLLVRAFWWWYWGIDRIVEALESIDVYPGCSVPSTIPGLSSGAVRSVE